MSIPARIMPLSPVQEHGKDGKDAGEVTLPKAVLERMSTALARVEELKESHNLDKQTKAEQLEALIGEVKSTCGAIDAVTAMDKAYVAYWLGHAHTARDDAESGAEAERQLAKAIKLAPSMVEAWNELGACYWRRKDLPGARNCFQNALQQRKTKQSLRSLSMVLRNMPTEDAKERLANLRDSVLRAREAVALDVSDGQSWYILGNAHLTQFFSSHKSSDDLEKALKAYQKAEVSPVSPAVKNPDLFFNRGNVHKFNEEYEDAIRDYTRASELDPSLPAKEHIEGVVHFVKKLSKLLATQAGLKPKKLASVVAALNTAATKAESSKPSASAEGKGEDSKPDAAPATTAAAFGALKPGVNAGVHCTMAAIAPVSRTEDVPTSFIVVDTEGAAMVLSVYNVTGALLDYIKSDHVVTVHRPVLKSVRLESEGATYSYNLISVRDITSILVNGKPLPPSCIAKPELYLKAFQ